MGSNVLSLATMTGFPRLNVTARADAATDRALAESGRMSLDNTAGRLAIKRRPSRADVNAIIRDSRKTPKLPPAVLLPAPAMAGGCLPC